MKLSIKPVLGKISGKNCNFREQRRVEVNRKSNVQRISQNTLTLSVTTWHCVCNTNLHTASM